MKEKPSFKNGTTLEAERKKVRTHVLGTEQEKVTKKPACIKQRYTNISKNYKNSLVIHTHRKKYSQLKEETIYPPFRLCVR